MDNLNQIAGNLSQMDKRSIKTEGVTQEDEHGGMSTDVWPIMDDDQHQFDLTSGSQQQQQPNSTKSKQTIHLQSERNYASPQQEALAAKAAADAKKAQDELEKARQQ